MLDAWIDDIGSYVQLQAEYNATIQWGVKHCGWPQPTILLPPGSTIADKD